jgi:hypothetical protein
MARSLLKRRIEQPDGSKITTAEAIVRALKAGAFLKDAAQAAGIAESTVHAWLARGHQWINPESGGRLANVPKADLPYLEFVESVEKARAEAVVFNLAVIRKAAQAGHWQAAAWYLERTRPDEYGRRTRFDVAAGGEGMTLAELLVSTSTDPDTANADPDIT